MVVRFKRSLPKEKRFRSTKLETPEREVDHPALTIAAQAVRLVGRKLAPFLLRKGKNLPSKFCYFEWVNWLHALGSEVNG